MTGTRTARRKPVGGVEVEALARWRASHPITAMRTLADAGYTMEQRAEFLRAVAGVQHDLVSDYAADSYVRMFD